MTRSGVPRQADSREKVLQALGQAATTLRVRLGESLATMSKFDKPLSRPPRHPSKLSRPTPKPGEYRARRARPKRFHC